MKARLKGRAKMTKACRSRLVRPREAFRHGHGSTGPTPAPWGPALNPAPSTKQAARGSGLRFGSNLRLKLETVLLFPGLPVEAVGCVFSPASAGPLFDFLFSDNVTFVDKGRPPFFKRLCYKLPFGKVL